MGSKGLKASESQLGFGRFSFELGQRIAEGVWLHVGLAGLLLKCVCTFNCVTVLLLLLLRLLLLRLLLLPLLAP